MWKILILCFCVGACLGKPKNPKDEVDGKGDRFVEVPDYQGNRVTIDNEIPVPPPASFFEPQEDVKYFLHTRETPYEGQRIYMNVDSIRNSKFKSERKTRFIIHGWNNDGDSSINVKVPTALLTVADVNVIVVDWGAGAQTLDYGLAKDRTYMVGPFVGAFINFLHSSRFIRDFKDINIIGHSLGAHIAGIAGKNTKEKVAIIFGLDPASPLFVMSETNKRLDVGDAIQTVAVHTSAKFKGMYPPIAKVDIYVNGGWNQPGCGFDFSGSCGHSRAYELFAEAATTDKGFVARKCNNFEEATDTQKCNGEKLVFVAETSEIDAQGIYLLITNEVAPYAMG